MYCNKYKGFINVLVFLVLFLVFEYLNILILFFFKDKVLKRIFNLLVIKGKKY